MTRNMVRIGDVCTVVSGSTPKTSVAEYWDGDIKWITPAELTEDTFYLHDSVRHITELGKEKTGLTYMPCGTVILSSRAPIGKTAIIACEMCCNQGFKNLICSDKIFNEYLYFFLSAKTKYLNSLGRGATFKEISKAIVENIMIPLPCIEQQKQIAARFAQIDDLIKLRRGQLQQLDQLVKSRFIELFGDPLLDDGRYLKVPLGTLAEVGSSKRIFEKEYVTEGVPFYRTKEIVELSKGNRITTELFITRERYNEIRDEYGVPQKGDLLISAVGTIGVIWIVDGKNDFYFKDGNLLRVAATEKFAPTYIKHLLEALIGAYKQEMSSGTAYAALTISALKEMLVYVVPLSEQEQFATFVEQTDKLKFAVQNAADLQIMLILNLANYHWKHRASVSDKGVKL